MMAAVTEQRIPPENPEVAESRQLLTEDRAILYLLREAPEGPRDLWSII